jgi:signal transduction histidine kinase
LFHLTGFSNNDYRTPRIKNLEQSIYELNNAEKYKLSLEKVYIFKEKNDIRDIELYYVHLITSYIHKRLFDYEIVLKELDKSLMYGKQTPHAKYAFINVQCEKAFAYFDIQNYDRSYQIMSAISDEANLYLSTETYSMYCMQLAYIHYLKQDYNPADSLYKVAIEYMKMDSDCHLPIIYTKQMMLYDKLGDNDKADRIFNKALEIADSCGIHKYTALTYEVKRIIAKNNDDFDTYLFYDKIFDSIKLSYNDKRQAMEIRALKSEMIIKEKTLKLDIKAHEIEQTRTYLFVIAFFLGLSILWGVLLIKSNLKLKAVTQRLENLNQLNKDIFTVISHDLKEPLIELKEVLFSLKQESNGFSPVITYIQSNLANVSGLLNDLITWSIQELNVSQNTPSALNDHIKKVLAQIENIQKKNITVINEVLPNVYWNISDWSMQIILRNILSNAAKFSFENGTIRIKIKDKKLLISNTGNGIDEQVRSKLFNARVKPRYGTNGESGFGIGLYITKVILEKNNYTIDAENTIENQTIFYIHHKTTIK